MLISCTSCNSKYLVNSADLKPSGRKVKCSKCGNQWYQSLLKDDLLTDKPAEIPLPQYSIKSNNKINEKLKTPNLPSTYVKEKKVSVINSILVVLIVLIFISSFWIIKNVELNNFILLNFYYNEFIFNLKLIFNDVVKIVHQIIN